MLDFKARRYFLGALVLVPFLMIAVSFFSDHWTWGLMDDWGLAHQTGGLWERFSSMVRGLFNAGSLRPTYLAYAAIFYPLFKDIPHFFYLFKAILVLGMLLIWGAGAYVLTGRKTAMVVLPLVAFCFYFFYDSFAYLSCQEPLGLLFTGLMFLMFLLGGWKPVFENTPLRWGYLSLGIVAMILGMGCKEIFLTVPGAFFAVSLALAWRRSRIDHGIFSLVGLLLIVAYAIYLKFFFAHGYSARYQLGNYEAILFNLGTWLRHSLVFHVPWLVLAGAAFFAGKRSLERNTFWGLLLGVAVYAATLFLLLPWQVTDFYAIPLGVYFAFITSMLVSKFLDECSGRVFAVVFVLSMVMVIAVSWVSFGKQVAYRNDTYQLIDWMEHNVLFRHEMAQGYDVMTNAMEAGDIIPAMLSKKTGQAFANCRTETMVKLIVYDKKAMYYLYNPRLGDQDLRRINQFFSVAFSSKSWTLFKRNFWPEQK